MPISIEKLVRLRPFLFHLTSASNAARILRDRRLDSANALLRKAQQAALGRVRRHEHVSVDVGGDRVELRDQAPLHAGNMALGGAWSFEDFVMFLNERVFFWPGTTEGPIPYGRRHYERYASETPSILRVSTAALLACNPNTPPMFCRYNSGSPRCSNGLKSPRTRETFRSGEEATFGVGSIVEVTFVEAVRLPAECSIASHPGGPWRHQRA